MTDHWNDIRDAIAAKLAASTLCSTAGLRTADTDAGDEMKPPSMRILQVASVTGIERPNAWAESYTLTIPAELIVMKPAGLKRSNPTVLAIARAVQVEWRTGIKLGLPSYVVESRLESWSEGLQEYAETGQDGGRFIFEVTVNETLTTIRTA